MLFADFVEDLTEFTVEEIETACRLYRQDGTKQFFPKPGELRSVALKERSDRIAIERLGPPIKNFDSRPIMWWMRRREAWKPHWRESEIPAEEFPAYRKLQERGAAPRYAPGTE